MYYKNLGFSLLELLVTLSIIALLSAIAIPSYTKYLEKAKVSELFMIADLQKLKILDPLDNQKEITCTNLGHTSSTPLSKYIENVILWKEKNQYFIQLKSTLGKDLILEFIGIDNDETINWDCYIQQEYSSLTKYCKAKEITLHKC